MASRPTSITFLGGAGEIGRSMAVVESDSKLLIVDVGLMFPTEEMLGVDLVLPDFEYVREREDDVVAIVLTHGHEDHIGGLPYLLKEMRAPIYGSKLTLGLLQAKLNEHRLEDVDLNEVDASSEMKIGPFGLQFYAMDHSIPDALCIMIDTAEGRLFFTGDFKIPHGDDPTVTDLGALKKMATGVDVLFSDSTNADRPGHTPSEKVVGEEIARVVSQAKGRVIVACFASNIHRVQEIVNAAAGAGRVVTFIGRSMLANVDVTRELGYLTIPDGMIVPLDEASGFPDDKLVIVCTGSQGEPFSALSLMASRDHKMVTLTPGDTVVLSATPIPGNESAVRRVIDGLFRIGVDVITAPTSPVHVSGHAAAEDLKLMIEAVSPRWLVPVHGEYRQLVAHAKLGEQCGLPTERILFVEDGDHLRLLDGKLKKGQRVEAGYVYVDGLGIGDVEDEVLRDRRLLADDGIVVCVVTIDAQTGELLAGPDVISRGFVFEDDAADFLEEARAEIRGSLASLAQDEITDWASVRRTVRRSLGKFVWSRTRRRPIILPVVMEV